MRRFVVMFTLPFGNVGKNKVLGTGNSSFSLVTSVATFCSFSNSPMEFWQFFSQCFENYTPFLIHPIISTCYLPFPSRFHNHFHSRVITYQFQGKYNFSLNHLNRSLSSTSPLPHFLDFCGNTKVHELWEISALNFYSSLCIFLEF